MPDGRYMNWNLLYLLTSACESIRCVRTVVATNCMPTLVNVVSLYERVTLDHVFTCTSLCHGRLPQ